MPLSNSQTIAVSAVILVVAVLVIIFGPLAIIWSVNTLFPVAAIPYGFYQWLAVAVLNLTIFGKFSYKFK